MPKHTDIQSIKRGNDSVAEVLIKYLSGKEQVSGSWERDVKQNVGPMDFSFDFKLSYYDHLYALMGTIKKSDDKLKSSTLKKLE